MKRSIAFFVYNLDSGGIERYLLRFLDHYKDQIKATIYCKSGKSGELEEEFSKINVLIKPFKLGNFNIKQLQALREEFKLNNYETVVDFTNNFAAFPLFIANGIGINRRIAWYRNADVKFKKTPFKLFFNFIVNKITRHTATDILSNSETAFNVFFKNYNWKKDSRFQVIYNGINSEKFLQSKNDLREELKIPKNAFVVGHVGRYDEQKNHKTAIQVAIKLCENNDNIYFLFVGRGVEKGLSQLIKDHSLSSKIILLGNRTDIPEVLNTLNCFYFPSTLEGNPNALIEAMISGLPLVTSNIAPIREIIPDELQWILVHPLDVDKASEKIIRIKEDVEFKNKHILKDWALGQFNAEIQFNKFFKKI